MPFAVADADFTVQFEGVIVIITISVSFKITVAVGIQPESLTGSLQAVEKDGVIV